MVLWHILSWLVAGLIVGGIARLIVPGRQPMGLVMTALLGIGGAFVGGFIWWLISGQTHNVFTLELAWPGYLLSIGGAVLLLVIGIPLMRRSKD